MLADLGMLNKAMVLLLSSSHSIVDSAEIQNPSDLRLICGIAASNINGQVLLKKQLFKKYAGNNS